VDGDGEREPHPHSRAVGAERIVDEVFELGKTHDGIEAVQGLPPREASNQRADERVLATGQLRMEAGAQIEEATVDFPEPFRPMTPLTRPTPMSTLISRRAQKRSRGFRRRNPRRKLSWNVCGRSGW
jgi:hypothetical protein